MTEASIDALHKSQLSQQRKLDFASIPPNIKQILHICASHKKPKKLIKTLTKLRKAEEAIGRRNPGLCMIFFNRIKTLIFIKKFILENMNNARVAELHGQMPQFARDQALQNFKAGKVHTLFCTDVAARGIHINHVSYVVNYDFPGSLEQYIHRCGRAGRSQSSNDEKNVKSPPTACVYSFFSREFSPMAPDMLELLRQSKSEYIDPNLISLANEIEEKRTKKSMNEILMKDNSDLDHTNFSIKKKSNIIPKIDNTIRSKPDDEEYETNSHKSEDDSIGEFKFLERKMPFKRAIHVSDASSDTSSNSD